MSKSPDLEMKLVAEVDSSKSGAMPEVAGFNSEQSNNVFAKDKAGTIHKTPTEPVESVPPETSGKLFQAEIQRQKWSAFVNSIDPIFYITCLVFSSLLFIGFYLLVNHNNELIVAHLKEVELGSDELSENLAQGKSASSIEALPVGLESPNQAELLPVQIQSRQQTEVIPQAASQLMVKSELSADNQPGKPNKLEIPTLNVRSPQSDEVALLQSLLAEKRQQLEILALENHELRLQMEFGESAITSIGRTYTSDANQLHTENVVKSIDSNKKNNNDTEAQIRNELIDTDSLIDQADAAMAIKNHAQASRLFLDVLQRNPDHRDANHGVAAVALVTGNTQLAIDRYRHLLRLNPDDQSVFSALLGLAAPDNMIETELLSHVSQFAKENAGLYSVLGHYFGRSARWDLANDAFNTALQNTSGMPANILFNLGVSYEHLGQTDNAIEAYKQVLSATELSGVDSGLVQQRLNELTM